ncbi:glycosyltransferase, partial [Candidatus Saccharibacteria bacterium]|nr:glycosyltransferase [Candidatus Saccharibacteria bacterium]NIW80012.1 DUF2064 domain-containing protein [Calditrichia bacterium]
MSHSNALIIFMKAPRLGKVKTRMQPQLSERQSLGLYKAMGLDLVNQFSDASTYDVMIYFWPPQSEEEMQSWLGDDKIYSPQLGNDLGEKMHQAFTENFNGSYQKVVIIGSDLPTLDETIIQEAFRHLNEHDAVLGPTEDGGYYLIALNKPQPELFKNVRWSSESVLPQTLENADKAGLSVHLLEQRTDIDTYDEVEQLRATLQQSPS